MNKNRILKVINADEVARNIKPNFDENTRAVVEEILSNVRTDGADAVRQYALRFDERKPEEPMVLGRPEMEEALGLIDPQDRAALERSAERVKRFAKAQRNSLSDINIEIPGGRAGHRIVPIDSAGCYAPAGRYPLPSSVLMTAIPARVAGCRRVVVASPGAQRIMLAAAAIAGADQFLAVGGAHAIGTMAYGMDDFLRCDVIVGPGNNFVTAAKHAVRVDVGIDMLAGPSELLILADETADPELIAADLLAQAEHDTRAVPMLITTDEGLIEQVHRALFQQLSDLPTSPVASRALENGFAIFEPDLERCIRIVNQIAPEHLEVMTDQADAVANRVSNAGAVFIGSSTGEVVGDYGAGPNHTLPTGGTARFQAGLSVMDFLRIRTWIRMKNSALANELLEDSQHIAQLEGLWGHKAAAAIRVVSS